jgi:hypothetical protein
MTMATFDPLAPTHLRLMAQLGHRVGEQMMGKSQAHASALHAHLTGNGRHSTHSPVPSNPQKAISASTKDETLLGADRRHNPDERAERDYERRRNEMTSQSKNKGAFDKLKDCLRAMASDTAEGLIKSLQSLHEPIQHHHSDSFEDRFGKGFSHAHVVGPVTAHRAAVASTKPTAATLAGSIKRVTSMMKSMGLEVSYDSDSATLQGGDAIRKQSLAGAKPSKPKAKPLCAHELLKAASTLLHHGRIDAQTAARVQTEVGLRGTVSPDLMKTLSEACKG